MPQEVVIVGGSVAGLIHGLHLKRNGNNVTILERDPRSLRSSHNAGIGYRAGMKEFLEKYDDTDTVTAIESNRLHITYRPYPKLFTKTVDRPLKYEFTSWGVLYRLLRANFDGFASKPFPNPPPRRAADGKATYLTGAYVVNLNLSGDKVIVHYLDESTGEEVDLTADLLIGADGVHSTVRKIVKAPTVREYAGMVAWRGTVPQSELSEATAKFFADGLVYDMMQHAYILCYVIPTDDGGLSPGKRLVNWCWYTRLAEGSQEMTDIFTDGDGNVHSNTLTQGMVSNAVWSRVRAAGMAKMSAPFAELLSKTENPFVTKVNDVLCTKARHLDGRVLLVGDALTTPRPNIAMSTEQAASQALIMEKALKGEISMENWEKAVLQSATKFYHLGRVVSDGGLGSWLTFGRSLRRYFAFVMMLKWKRG